MYYDFYLLTLFLYVLKCLFTPKLQVMMSLEQRIIPKVKALVRTQVDNCSTEQLANGDLSCLVNIKTILLKQ